MGNVAVTAAPADATRRRSPIDVSVDGRRSKVVKLTYSNSYATGGDSLAPADVGMERVVDVVLIANDASLAAGQKQPFTTSFVLTDPGAPKMKCYDAADTEEGNTTDRSTTSVIARVFGY